ncbi:roadblock/LC7 domain-containing protein [Pleurocapsa sp. FMAR1]|uniref:roadblock/LC7 domain-containing protein n=1 Tax=Pleurocapsa sp. FMAR1 TaxID=3040204 RepID=UPI0029C6A343|nr:roadblock/LC7 domain-containing protein [Pleurocapsa sp. FMAR1]
MAQVSMLTEMVQKFVTATPDIQGAALVTPDGLSLTAVLPGNMDEERTAAMSAAMLSLGERIGQELSRGIVDRIVVEGEKGYSVMVSCGEDAVLLVLASKEVKQGLLFLEIKRIVKDLAPMMS